MTKAPRKTLAIAASAALIASALIVAVTPAAANATTASSIASIKAELDSARVDLGSSTSAYLTNGFVSAYAQDKVAKYASCGASCAATAAVADALPASSGPADSWHAAVSVTGSGADAKLASALVDDFTGDIVGADNYIGIGYLVKGTHTYVYVVGVQYTTAPLERFTPGKVTIPSSVSVGKAIVATISGFAGPGSKTLNYVWQRGTTDVGFAPSYTPTSVDFADKGKLRVLVSATDTGYVEATATSNTTAVVHIGTLAASTPVLSGRRYVGQTLQVTSQGGWAAGVNTAIAWLRDGKVIAGQTDTSYVLVAADRGHKIDVRVTGSSPGFTTKVVHTATSTATGWPLLPTTAIPTIFSTGIYGSPAGIIPGSWGPGTVKFTYQWRIDGGAIAGATKSIYTLGTGVIGRSLTVSITGSEVGYTSITRTSAPITPTPLDFTAVPFGVAVTGAFQVGHTVTVSHGTWSPAATSYQYQWFLDSTAIAHATSASYKIPASAAGHLLIARVTGVRAGYRSTFAYGPSTTVVP
jgi:hypothetical protein